MRRLIAALSIAGLVLVAAAPSALATTTRYDVDDLVYPTVADPGVWTFTGNVLLVRDMVAHSNPVDDVLGPGYETVVQSFNMNLANGRGAVRGKTEIAYASGSWICSWEGQFDPEQFYWDGQSLLYAFTAHEICHGTDDMTGAQLRLDFTASDFSPVVHAVGYWFVPGDRTA